MDEPRQNRSRRYVLLVALISLAVLGRWWAHRGVIDPRLIGRWENVIADGLPGDMNLDADGAASYVAAYVSFPVYDRTSRWCVQDDNLVLTAAPRFDGRISWRALRHNSDLIWSTIRGSLDGIRLRIVQVREHELKLELDHPWGRDDGPVVTLRRLSTQAPGPQR